MKTFLALVLAVAVSAAAVFVWLYATLCGSSHPHGLC